jgi:hypothetical protein
MAHADAFRIFIILRFFAFTHLDSLSSSLCFLLYLYHSLSYHHHASAILFISSLTFGLLAGAHSSDKQLHASSQDVLDFRKNETDDKYRSKYIRYAAFGDSWSSGVNYGPASQDLEYDWPNGTETCRCRRVNEAWPVQLRDEVNNRTNITTPPAWTYNRTLELDFLACHGTCI